jgi:cell division protein DivIC
MRELQIRRRGFPPSLVLAVVGPACVLILAATAQRAVEGYAMGRQVESMRREVGDLRQQNLELQARITRYRSDSYVERIAREELNLVRPGDVPVIIIAPTPQPAAAPARPPATPAPAVPVQWLHQFLDEP